MKFECGVAGNFNSTIAIVGDAPGERDVRVNQPFIGQAGATLFDALRRDGYTRNHVYLTHVVKRAVLSAAAAKLQADRKPPIGRAEFEGYAEILREELDCLPNLRYVLALGPYALQALTGEKAIKHWRGSVIPVRIRERSVTVIIAENPGVVQVDPLLEIVFKLDMSKLARVIKGTFKPDVLIEHINPTYNEVMQFVQAMIHDQDQLPFAYDIESMGNETACIGFAISEEEGMCINFRNQNENVFSTKQEIVLRRLIQTLFTSARKKQRTIGQNTNFDNYWLGYKDRIEVGDTWFDTMLAHHQLYPPLPHNLGFLTAQYTDNPYYKDDGKFWKEGKDGDDINTFWRYNVKDCCYTLQIARKEKIELERVGLDKFFFEWVMPLQSHLVGMTVGGVKSDRQLKQRFTDDLTKIVQQARQLCNEKASVATNGSIVEFNPNSPKQLGNLLFNELKLVGRGSSTDKKNRERITRHPRTNEAARELISAVDIYARDAKFLSTYASATIDGDGRFRCEYKQTGVSNAPGRLSSASVMWGSGLNLQNIPERGKPMFVADDGYEFSYFDMAQIEARYVAWLANITKWKDQFERARLNPGSYDAHRALAADMWKLLYDDVPSKDFVEDPATGLSIPTKRYIAKRCRHGLNYRMQADRLAETSGLSFSEAEIAFRRYHQTTPEIMKWWEDTIAEAKKNRCLYSPLGRRWVLLERWDDDALDSIVAFKPQSTAGDWVASVIKKCQNDPRWPRDKARIILNIHDANIAQNKPEVGPLVRSLMRSYAEEPIMINGEPCIVPAEFGVSQPDEYGVHRWSTIQKIKEQPELLKV